MNEKEEQLHTEEVPRELARLLDAAKNIEPSFELKRATLEKVQSARLVRSPYVFTKISITLFAMAVLVIGGVTLYQYNSVSSPSTGTQVAISDAALQSDAAAIDSQLSGLDSDNSAIDQSVGD